MNLRKVTKRLIVCLLVLSVLATIPYETVFSSQGGTATVQAYAAAFSEVDSTDRAQSFSKHLNTDTSTATAAHPFLKSDDIVEVIVEMNDKSLVDMTVASGSGTIRDYLKTAVGKNYNKSLFSKQQSLQSVMKDVVDIEFSFNYNALISGFAAKVKYGDISTLKKLTGVKNVIVAEQYYQPEAVTVDNPVNVDAITGIYDSSDLGYDGTGSLIGVIDTGLDYTHKAFHTMPSDSGKLSKTLNDVKDMLSESAAAALWYGVVAEEVYISQKVPFAFDYGDYDPDVYPTNSHGTHVAGVVAGGDDVFTGVAPNAQIAVFKVSRDGASTMADTSILASLNDAILIGCDVVNMSLGATAGFALDAESSKIDSIYNKVLDVGVNLMVAAGNESNSAKGGTYGDTNLASNPDSGTVGSPSSYASALSVASINGLKSTYLEANGSIPIYITESTNDSSKSNNFLEDMEKLYGSMPQEYEYVIVPGLGRSSNYSTIDVKGKIAVVKRGDISFEDKARNAADEGAIACLIYNNISGSIAPYVRSYKDIPVASMTMDNAALLSQTGTIKLQNGFSGGPFISDFSSWGVLPNLELKPEITAHGGNITSAVIGGGHESMSGTSMASPNLAGAITLVRQYLKEKYPTKNAIEITMLANQYMMSTATIAKNEDGNPYSPRKQGAGLADMYGSVETDAYLYVEGSDKTKLSLGDDPSKSGEYDMTFYVRNTSAQPLTYKLNASVFTETLSSDGKTVAEKAYMLSDSKLTFYVNGQKVNGLSPAISVGGYKDAKIEVKVELSDKSKSYMNNTFENGMYIEGFIELNSLNQEGNINLSIPYVAFYGDWAQAPMLDPSIFEVGESARDSSVADRDKLKAAVYASEPIATFWDDAQAMVMGNYVFRRSDGTFADETESDMDKAALSSLEGSATKMDGIYAGLLRSAKNIDIEVSHTLTGKSIWTHNLTNIRKAFNYGGGSTKQDILPGLVLTEFEPYKYGLADNAQYTVSMTTSLDWASTDNNKNNNFSFNFYMDSQKPVMEKIEYRKEKSGSDYKHYIDIYVYDNHYVQAMAISTYKQAIGTSYEGITELVEGMIPIDSARNSVNKVTVDVTENWDLITRNNEQLVIEFFDYAMNYSMWDAQIGRTAITNLEFTQDSVDIDINSTVDLKQYLSATPEFVMLNENELRNLSWTVEGGTLNNGVSQNSILKVKDGSVTGLAEGEAYVTVTFDTTVYKSASTAVSATIKINVSNKKTLDSIALAGLSAHEALVNSYELLYDADGYGYSGTIIKQIAPILAKDGRWYYHLTQGDTGTFSVTALPWNISNEALADVYSRITWKSSNNNIVSIEQDPNDPMKVSFHVRAGTASSASVTAQVGYIDYVFRLEINTVFVVENNVLTEYNGQGLNGVVEIPSNLNITSIGTQAFYSTYTNNFMNSIKKVIIPEGVIEVGSGAFFQVEGLEEVVLPSTATSVSTYAFAYCLNLKTINLDNVESIGAYAFYSTMLKNLGSTSKVKTIGSFAFSGDESIPEFTYIDLSLVSYVGAYAFANCPQLSRATFNKNLVIGDQAFANTGFTELVIPFAKLSYGAFARCAKLTSVIFQSDVFIDGYAFFDCVNLSSVEFNEKCTNIGVAAFYGNYSLTSIRLPNGLKNLDQLAFASCISLETVLISAGADFKLIATEKYNENTRAEGGIAQFAGCTALERIDVEAGNSSFSSVDGILFDKAKTTLILYPSAKELPSGDFSTANIPSTVKTIGDYALAQKDGLKTVSSLAGIEKIGSFAFYACDELTSVNFGSAKDTLTHIGESAFESCISLTALRNTNSDYALSGALKLKYLGDQAFCAVKGNNGAVTLNLGVLSLDYLGIGVFADSQIYGITLPTSLSEIPAGLFYNCNGLKTVSIPDNYTSIGLMAFYGTALDSITLPSALEYIGQQSFCYSTISEIIIPSSVTVIDDYAFAYCYNILRVEFEQGVPYVGIGMFLGCTQLATVELAESVKILKEDAFLQCTALTQINFEHVVYFYFRALAGTSIVEFDAPEALYIGSDMFFDSYTFASANISLVSVNAPKATFINNDAFRYCFYLTNISLPSATYIGSQAFYLAAISTDSTLNIDISSVEYIGRAAFSATKINEFYIPASLEMIEDTALINIEGLKRFIVDKDNKHFFADGGVLYSYLPNGGYQLECAPDLYKFTNDRGGAVYSYTVLEGTVRIAEGAFFYNKELLEIILPRTLKSIGAGAFLQTTIVTYRFNSVIAPTLETQVSTGFYDYNNFMSHIMDSPVLTMIYPSNGKGYDGHIYSNYFAMRVPTVLAMEDSTFETYTAISKLSTTITLNDEQAIIEARGLYNSISKEQQALVTNYAKLTEAEEAFNKLLNQGGTDETPVEEPEKNGLGGGMIALIVILSVVALLGAAAVVYFVVIKRGKSHE